MTAGRMRSWLMLAKDCNISNNASTGGNGYKKWTAIISLSKIGTLDQGIVLLTWQNYFTSY
jgi:hypothetical protein